MKSSPSHVGPRRPRAHAGRSWDRGLYLCVLALVLLSLALGGFAVLSSAVGKIEVAEVRSCSKHLHVSGHSWRHQTRCTVVVAGHGTHDVDTNAPHPSGTHIQVVVLAGQVSDLRLARSQRWFLAPAPLLIVLLMRNGWPRRR